MIRKVIKIVFPGIFGQQSPGDSITIYYL